MIRTIFSLCFLVALAGSRPSIGHTASVLESPLEITMAAFRQVDCMDETRYNYYREIIKSLSYTRMRALRAFCYLDGFYADEAIETLERLAFEPLTFDQVRLFEAFSELDGASSAAGWQLLDTTRGLDFTTMQTVSALSAIDTIDAGTMLSLVRRIKELDAYGHWAAAALLAVPGIDRQSADLAFELIGAMTTEQKLSAEKSCLIDAMEADTIMAILPRIAAMDSADSMNIRGLFGLESITPGQARSWAESYFSLGRTDQDSHFYSLPPGPRAILLSSFDNASDYHIRVINDLHAVTRDDGSEISTASLVAGGAELIGTAFARLHPRARGRYEKALDDAIDQGTIYPAIEVLKQATAFARKQTAEDLTTANLYILLSRGSELYDSSFRDVLVPVLLARIDRHYDGDLLLFLQETDPGNDHVSDFIISSAQKGKLTAFFPDSSDDQRAVLDLIGASAFQDEQSLILFSATFATLLEKLQPDARTYLLNRMVATISDPASTFARQIRVILQYYHDKHPQLLSAADLGLIAGMIERFGSIDLTIYTKNDFSRWKADGRLSSLSVFQDDDDGRLSYLSNSRNLLSNGYRARLPETIRLLDPDSPVNTQARRLIAQGNLASLYRLSADTPLIIEYHKMVNNIELSHAVVVYQDRLTQRRLLEQFLQSGMEMFAQRGHSYWRQDQLLEPMRQLIDKGELQPETIPDINRFLSIGSCGGIRIYSELNRLFNNTIDIFATVGTGKAVVNDPYNQRLFEIIAASPNQLSWDEVSARLSSIFSDGRGADYLQPGSLPAILHKMMDSGS